MSELKGKISGSGSVRGSLLTIPRIVNDLTTGGASMALSAEMGKVLGQRPNPNLLDNWYFGNPVDQRSGYVVPPGAKIYNDAGLTNYRTTATVYTKANYVNGVYGTIVVNSTTYYVAWSEAVRGYAVAGYTIDRWKSSASSNIIAVADGCVEFTVASSGQSIQQPMERWEELKGKTLTASMLLAAGATARICIIVTGGTTMRSSYISSGIGSVTATIPEEATNVYVAIQSNSVNSAVKLIAAKLELGTQQTLAHKDASGNWVLNEIPDYNEQLLRCCMSKADSSDTYANNKLTAAAVNAVPLDGSKTMTGALSVNNGYGKAIASGESMGISHRPAPSDKKNYSFLSVWGRNALSEAVQFWRVTDGVENHYNLLHTGNKPSGSYTGNGSSAYRSVPLGGIGRLCLITRNGNYWALVSARGAIISDGSSVIAVNNTIFDGACNLQLSTSHAALNENGVTYTCHVL